MSEEAKAVGYKYGGRGFYSDIKKKLRCQLAEYTGASLWCNRIIFSELLITWLASSNYSRFRFRQQ